MFIDKLLVYTKEKKKRQYVQKPVRWLQDNTKGKKR